MNKTPIVITTIFPPTEAIKLFVKKRNNLIIVGDTKTPDNWSHAGCDYLSLAKQKSLFSTFASFLPTKHYARKNIGYLYAMLQGHKSLIDTDDDNFPYSFFPNFLTREKKVVHLSSENNFFNTYAYFRRSKQIMWPRGYPLNLILQKPKFSSVSKKRAYPLQQSLVNEDSDFDAVYRLTINKEVKFKKNVCIALSPHTYSPINSQSTFWTKEAFLLLYLPSTVKSRVTDIYRGYIAQRLLWEINATALFVSPCLYQKRNPHNYLHDFKEEVPIYEKTNSLIEVLESLKLSGSIEAKLMQSYKALVKNSFLLQDELKILREWIKRVDKLI